MSSTTIFSFSLYAVWQPPLEKQFASVCMAAGQEGGTYSSRYTPCAQATLAFAASDGNRSPNGAAGRERCSHTDRECPILRDLPKKNQDVFILENYRHVLRTVGMETFNHACLLTVAGFADRRGKFWFSIRLNALPKLLKPRLKKISGVLWPKKRATSCRRSLF